MSETSDKSDVPRLRTDVDLTKLGLSVEEGFIASRIDGHSSIHDIALMVGKPEEATRHIIQRLSRAGVVLFGDDEVKAPANPKTGEQGYGNFIFPVALMHEEVNLEEDERKRIIYFHSNLEKWTHYELLQVSRKDDAKTIKRAYFARSKEWHPDRFRRGDLGSFKKMIDDIFKAVGVAHGVLSNDKKREAYDEEHVFMANEDDVAQMLKTQKKKERDERREKERLERRKRRNPVRKRMGKAKDLMTQALEAEERGELLDALRLAQTAAAFDKREDYDEIVERLKFAAGELRVGPFIKRGISREHMTNWSEAIEMFSEAVRIAPDNGQARIRLAFNLVMGGHDPSEAIPHAQKGIHLCADDPEAHFVLGLCYEKGGMQKAAVRELSKALELKPNYKEAKKRLRELKWGF